MVESVVVIDASTDGAAAKAARARDIAGRLWPSSPIAIEPLSGGLTNANFKVVTDDSAYVIRLLAPNAELLGIDRTAEEAAARAAAELGLAPEVVASLPGEGAIVTRFLEGSPITPEGMAEPETIARVAAALRRIHAGPPIPGRMDPFRTVEDYEAIARRRGVRAGETYDWAHPIAARVEAAVRFGFTAPCHGDLLNGNFIDDGALRILDWEYAGMSDPRGDLADLSAFHGFGGDHDRELVRQYYGSADGLQLDAVRVLRFMTFFRAGMWAVVQQAISDLDEDFEGWAAEQFDGLRAWGTSDEFAAHLAALEAAR